MYASVFSPMVLFFRHKPIQGKESSLGLTPLFVLLACLKGNLNSIRFPEYLIHYNFTSE